MVKMKKVFRLFALLLISMILVFAGCEQVKNEKKNVTEQAPTTPISIPTITPAPTPISTPISTSLSTPISTPISTPAPAQMQKGQPTQDKENVGSTENIQISLKSDKYDSWSDWMLEDDYKTPR